MFGPAATESQSVTLKPTTGLKAREKMRFERP